MAIKTISYDNKNYELSYEILNKEKEKNILILHGWGSNKEIMKNAFEKSFEKFSHIYLDLPGFGKSQIHSPLNSKDYALIITEFLKEINKKVEFILGHSFGGKIATLLDPKCLILLSSAGIIRKKKFIVKFKIFIFKILKLFGAKSFFKFFASKDVNTMSEVMYETFKKVVDENMEEYFVSFKGKAFIFWGKDDMATPLQSGEIIHKNIKNSEFFVLEGDHFFFINHSSFISNKVENYDVN